MIITTDVSFFFFDYMFYMGILEVVPDTTSHSVH
jgi:hypothetical protein